MNSYFIEFKWDDEGGVWYAVNDEIPLALESGSLDVLMERVKLAVPEILDLNERIKSRHVANAIMRQSGINHRF